LRIGIKKLSIYSRCLYIVLKKILCFIPLYLNASLSKFIKILNNLYKIFNLSQKRKHVLIIFLALILSISFLSMAMESSHSVNIPRNIGSKSEFSSLSPNFAGKYNSSEWTQFQGSSFHNGFSTSSGPSNDSLIWKYDLGGGTDTILEYDNNLIVTEPDQEYGYYYDLSTSSGSLKWTGYTAHTAYNDPTSVGSYYPAISSGKIMLQDFCIGCFFSEGPWLTLDNSSSGNNINVSSIGGSMIFNRDYGYGLIAACNSSFYYAFNGNTNLSLFRNNLLNPLYRNLPWAIDTVPTLEHGLVILGFSNSSYLTALNSSNLTTKWNLELDSPVFASASYFNGTIYAATSEGSLYAISNNGNIYWKDTFPDTHFNNTPSVCNSNIYIPYGNVLYSIDRLNGKLNWKKSFSENITVSPVISSNRRLYFGGNDGVVYAINSSGSIIWSYGTGSAIFTEPILYNGTLYLTNGNGTVMALGNAYGISFHRYELESGSYWWVSFKNGLNYSSVQSNMEIFLPNGTYEFTFGTYRTSMLPSRYLNYLNVSGEAIHEPIYFTEGFRITFSENNLPGGYIWMVNLSNGIGKDAPSGSNISFCLPNGTYSYRISSSDNLYSANPSSGTIHVYAANLSEATHFGHTAVVVFVITAIFGLFIGGSLISLLLLKSDYFDVAFAIAGGLAGAALYYIHSSAVFESTIGAVFLLSVILIFSLVLVKYVYALSLPLNILLLLVLYHISNGTAITFGNTLGWMFLYPVLGNYAYLMIIPIGALTIMTWFTFDIEGMDIDEGPMALSMHVITESSMLIFAIWFLIKSSVWPDSYLYYLAPIFILYIVILIPLHVKFSEGFDKDSFFV
jgi:hypothetical protein